MSMLGKDGLLYRNTGTNASPVWVQVNRVSDLNTPLTKGEADVSRRESDWVLKKGTLKEGEISFTYRYKKGTDADYAVLLDSFVNDTPIQWAAMDQAIATSGARGFKAFFEVFDLSNDQPLTEGTTISVTMKPTDHEESDALVEPELVTIA